MKLQVNLFYKSQPIPVPLLPAHRSEPLAHQKHTLRFLSEGGCGYRHQAVPILHGNPIFVDENKRTAVIFSNHYLISKGQGLFVIPESHVPELKRLLQEPAQWPDSGIHAHQMLADILKYWGTFAFFYGRKFPNLFQRAHRARQKTAVTLNLCGCGMCYPGYCPAAPYVLTPVYIGARDAQMGRFLAFVF